MDTLYFPANREETYGLLRSKFEKLDEGGKNFITKYVHLLEEYRRPQESVSGEADPRPSR